jgi:predicted alpha/beta hydrolase
MHLTQPIGATGILLVWVCALTLPAVAQESPLEADGVTVDSDGWQLVGDLTVPTADDPIPAVLMLNQAAGDRVVYAKLARHLADRGIASLRLDLRGHGESTNLGVFTPGEHRRDPLIWDAEVDVAAAHAYLKADPRLDAGRIGIVGASYSGEEMVALSPGSFEDLSIAGIDASGVPWLFVVSRDERFLQEITVAVREQSTTVEMVVVPGQRHASDLLVEHPDLSERVAVWLAHHLQ